MACQYFASIINNKRGTVKFWNFVRKENLSLWEGFCKFILKHDISNRRRTWACPRQKCVKERQVAIVAVVEVVKSYLVAIYPFCWVRYVWYISSWISALYFHKLPVPLFLHSLDLCTLSSRSVVCRVTTRFFGPKSQLLQTLSCTNTIHMNAKEEKM